MTRKFTVLNSNEIAINRELETTGYDTVKLVADNLASITPVGDNIAAVVNVNANITALLNVDSNTAAILQAETNSLAAEIATAADVVTTGLNVSYSEEWAINPEDVLVSAAAGGNQVDEYSSMHHRNKAAAIVGSGNGIFTIPVSMTQPLSVGTINTISGALAVNSASGVVTINSALNFIGSTIQPASAGLTINAVAGNAVTIEGVSIDGGIVTNVTDLTATTLNGTTLNGTTLNIQDIIGTGAIIANSANPLALNNIAGEMNFDSRTGEDGSFTTKINWDGSAGHGADFAISRGVQYVANFPEHAVTGDGACSISFDVDTNDGLLKIGTWDNSVLAGDPIGDPNVEYRQLSVADTHQFNVNGTVQLEVNESFVNLHRGQLRFPGTSNPSTNVNTLDDYEEGDYDAVLSASTSGTITLATNERSLAYTKIGRKVTITGRIKVFSVSSPVGNLQMTLPFNVANLADNGEAIWTPVDISDITTHSNQWGRGMVTAGGSNLMDITVFTDSAIADNVQALSQFGFNFSYFTDE